MWTSAVGEVAIRLQPTIAEGPVFSKGVAGVAGETCRAPGLIWLLGQDSNLQPSG
jgi:hypothetical protein